MRSALQHMLVGPTYVAADPLQPKMSEMFFKPPAPEPVPTKKEDKKAEKPKKVPSKKKKE